MWAGLGLDISAVSCFAHCMASRTTHEQRRRVLTPFLCGLLLLGADCEFTVGDLRVRNPHAEVVYICDKPLEVPPDIDLFAYDQATGEVVSAYDWTELSLFASRADVFFQYDQHAPRSSLNWAPPEWGLTCAGPSEWFVPSSELFRRIEPCSNVVAEGEARPDARWIADTAKGNGRCDPPVQPKKKGSIRVRVCVRPPGISEKVLEWSFTTAVKGSELTEDRKKYAAGASTAQITLVFDEKAPPESVYYFVQDPKLLSCPKKWPPRPYAEVAGSGKLPYLAEVSSAVQAAAAAKQGAGQTSSTSSPDGKGPALSLFEKIANNLVVAGALAQGDTSGNLKDPNGDRNGIPGGKNVGGFSFPPLQAGVGLLQILTSAGLSPKSFIDDIVKYSKQGQRTLIKEADTKMMAVADELLKKHSPYEMAQGLQEMQTIMPFELGQKFTAELGGKFQAHKIFERRAIKKFMEADKTLSKEAVEKAVDEMAKKYPSVILTDAEHQQISNALAAAWNANPNMSKAELREIYKVVYKKHPEWLEAIESYLR